MFGVLCRRLACLLCPRCHQSLTTEYDNALHLSPRDCVSSSAFLLWLGPQPGTSARDPQAIASLQSAELLEVNQHRSPPRPQLRRGCLCFLGEPM